MATETGTVKFFNKEKGFGFITTGNGDIFVHATELKEEIKDGDKVIFETKQGKKGLSAANVKKEK